MESSPPPPTYLLVYHPDIYSRRLILEIVNVALRLWNFDGKLKIITNDWKCFWCGKLCFNWNFSKLTFCHWSSSSLPPTPTTSTIGRPTDHNTYSISLCQSLWQSAFIAPLPATAINWWLWHWHRSTELSVSPKQTRIVGRKPEAQLFETPRDDVRREELSR